MRSGFDGASLGAARRPLRVDQCIRQVIGFAWACGTAAGWAAPAPDVACVVVCLEAGCLGSAATKSGGRVPLGKERVRAEPCLEIRLTEGIAKLSYLRSGVPFVTPIDSRRPVGQVLAAFPPDPCSLGDPDCQQKKMAGVRLQQGGHGIDGRVAAPAGEGDPCALGLPCGRVVPPAGPWTWRLTQPTLQGELVITTIRSANLTAAARFSAPVANGRVRIDATAIDEAGVFGYVLRDTQGRQVASGEFGTLSSNAVKGMRDRLAQAAAQGRDVDEVRVELFHRNGLDWDLYQWSRGNEP